MERGLYAEDNRWTGGYSSFSLSKQVPGQLYSSEITARPCASMFICEGTETRTLAGRETALRGPQLSFWQTGEMLIRDGSIDNVSRLFGLRETKYPESSP